MSKKIKSGLSVCCEFDIHSFLRNFHSPASSLINAEGTPSLQFCRFPALILVASFPVHDRNV